MALETPDHKEELIRKHFHFTGAGLKITGRPSLALCGTFVEGLKKINESLQFAIGDAVNYAESMFGDAASQIVGADDEVGAAVGQWSESTIRNYAWVAARVPAENRRMRELSFSHHQIVAALEPSQQKVWLERAVAGDEGVAWSTSQLQKAVKASVATEAAPEGATKYTVTVECSDPTDVEAFCRQLDNLGRTTYKKHLPK